MSAPVATPLSPHRPTLLWSWVIIALLGAVVATLAVTTHTGISRGLDVAVWNSAVVSRTPAVVAISKFLAVAFGTESMIVCSLLLATLLWWGTRAWHLAAMFVGSGALATLTTTTLKFLILRERPPVADRLTIESTFSFPSGHSSSAAAFLVAGALVLVTLAPKLKPWAWIITPLLVASVMASRLYLGVHWFTDVVAGASVGTAAALFAFWVYQRFSPDARAEDAGSSPLRSIRAERVRE